LGWLLLIALAVGGLGLWLLIRASRIRRTTALPVGRVTYADTEAWDRCEKPLFSNEHRLTGKPDYLVRSRKGMVPVEVKSGPAPDQPYPGHVQQLVAYCLLVEKQEGHAPPYGIIKYDDRSFEVDYTPALRSELLRTLDAMRHDLRARDLDRNHDEPSRCAGCGYREQCAQRLG
jgi:CRISPR-associated exonuclease Cas4